MLRLLGRRKGASRYISHIRLNSHLSSSSLSTPASSNSPPSGSKTKTKKTDLSEPWSVLTLDEEEQKKFLSSILFRGEYFIDVNISRAQKFYAHDNDLSAIKQCCVAFDSMENRVPALVSEGYSRLLKMFLEKKDIRVVRCIVSSVQEKEIHLDNALNDLIISFFTINGLVDDALVYCQRIHLTRNIVTTLSEPLFLANQHSVFAQLFDRYCLQKNPRIHANEIHLAVVAIIWAIGLSPPRPAERHGFLSALLKSMNEYKANHISLFGDTKAFNFFIINRYFSSLSEILRYVILNDDGLHGDLDGAAAHMLSLLRLKFANSKYCTPFPFMRQDCPTTTNFPVSVNDITAQVETAATRNEKQPSPFFLTNYLWAQDYSNSLNKLFEDRDEYYYSNGDYDYNSEVGSSDSDSDSSEYSGIDENEHWEEDNMERFLCVTPKEVNRMEHDSVKPVDMASVLAFHQPEPQHITDPTFAESKDEIALQSLLSAFQGSEVVMSFRVSHFDDSDEESWTCPFKRVVARSMQSLGREDEFSSIEICPNDISDQCRPAQPTFSKHFFSCSTSDDGPYNAIKFIKDDVNWDPWIVKK